MNAPSLAEETGRDAVPAARISGRISAVAGQAQRQMRSWAAAYPGLFGAEAFDPALFSTLSLAAAFSGPWHTADELRMANRMCLWCFALDYLVDYAATTEAEVTRIVERCEAVAGGARPAADDELTVFLAEIRDELAALPAFAELGGVWRDELRRMLAAMAREWTWKAARRDGDTGRPTLAEYLDNADNLGFSFVFAAHWIATCGTGPGGGVDPVRQASRAVQRVIRLLNDLGTYERDLKWGDLNALLLDATREEVGRRVAEATAEARRLLELARAEHPREADYMERQMDFCAGFYRVTDYWGAP
ncbi:terpene synthase family protein [Thermomonospora cellulosilytica]|uniref:Terpene synthase n=1 Tax=Thermomonospora cellulosilytica TaxID=1411118 RepID=A0A7W3N4Z8_9ACTN|nr:terpene synthase family protein [Thermomonospora cellulosilytica]MBA9007578.1 hypothetical protein [Thermomonospora cellulosilytica]